MTKFRDDSNDPTQRRTIPGDQSHGQLSKASSQLNKNKSERVSNIGVGGD